jgi:hypothetical protein
MDSEQCKRGTTQSPGAPTPAPGGRRVIDLKDLVPRDGLGASGDLPRLSATLTDELRSRKKISHDEWRAACRLRELYLAVNYSPSEGVGAYDLHPHGDDPVRRAERRADRTIRKIEGRGELHRQLNAALFAVAGYTTVDGTRAMVPGAVQLMIRAAIDNEPPIKQGEVGEAVSLYKPGERNKQVLAAGTTWVQLHLKRLAGHFLLSKGEVPPR